MLKRGEIYSEWDVFFWAINGFSLKYERSEFFKEAIIARNNSSYEVLGMKFNRLQYTANIKCYFFTLGVLLCNYGLLFGQTQLLEGVNFFHSVQNVEFPNLSFEIGPNIEIGIVTTFSRKNFTLT